jgi:hypothetical protein
MTYLLSCCNIRLFLVQNGSSSLMLILSIYDTFMQTTPRIGFWLDNSNQTPQQTAETILNTRKPV